MKTNKNLMGLLRNLIFLNLCIVFVLVAGCAPLKKKFTRKKKEEREQKFIPVLEPVDYSVITQSSVAQYKQDYSLWMVWQKDLLQAIERDGSTKNQKYLLSKAIDQLVEMNQWLVEEKKQGLEEIVNLYAIINKEYEKPDAFRDRDSMIRKVNLAGKKVRLNYSPRVLGENSFIGQTSESEK